MRGAVVSVVVLGLCSLAAPAARAQGGRKVYISVDMEGISGVNGNDQTSAGQPEYARARKLMADDANAAIRGAFAGGATAVRGERLARQPAQPAARGSRSARQPDRPQLQAARHDGRPRRDVRLGALHRLPRQGRRAARAVCAHRIGRGARRAVERRLGRRGRHERGDGRVVRRGRGARDRRRRRRGGSKGHRARRARRWR